MPVAAVNRWHSNAELIFDAYWLGYVHGEVYDVTPGDAGGLWTRHLRDDEGVPRPGITVLAANEASPSTSMLPPHDFRELPWQDERWDTVLFDPPYKLNGTPRLGLDSRYGVNIPTPVPARHALMTDGLIECARVLAHRGHLLVKCQDQVASGRMHWQTDMLTRTAENLRLFKVDRFDLIGHSVPQPMEGRQQRHAHGRGSTLLVFQKVIFQKGSIKTP